MIRMRGVCCRCMNVCVIRMDGETNCVKTKGTEPLECTSAPTTILVPNLLPPNYSVQPVVFGTRVSFKGNSSESETVGTVLRTSLTIDVEKMWSKAGNDGAELVC